MNREIEFRGWHRDNSEMVYIDNDKAMTDPYIMQHLAALIAGKHPDGEIMQYTGLKDKQGVKIFEGDIVEGILNKGVYLVNHGNFNNSDVDPDHGDQKGYGWFLERIDWKAFEVMVESSKYLKVIGNIHTTPELLEVGNG